MEIKKLITLNFCLLSAFLTKSTATTNASTLKSDNYINHDDMLDPTKDLFKSITPGKKLVAVNEILGIDTDFLEELEELLDIDLFSTNTSRIILDLNDLLINFNSLAVEALFELFVKDKLSKENQVELKRFLKLLMSTNLAKSYGVNANVNKKLIEACLYAKYSDNTSLRTNLLQIGKDFQKTNSFNSILLIHDRVLEKNYILVVLNTDFFAQIPYSVNEEYCKVFNEAIANSKNSAEKGVAIIGVPFLLDSKFIKSRINEINEFMKNDVFIELVVDTYDEKLEELSIQNKHSNLLPQDATFEEKIVCVKKYLTLFFSYAMVKINVIGFMRLLPLLDNLSTHELSKISAVVQSKSFEFKISYLLFDDRNKKYVKKEITVKLPLSDVIKARKQFS